MNRLKLYYVWAFWTHDVFEMLVLQGSARVGFANRLQLGVVILSQRQKIWENSNMSQLLRWSYLISKTEDMRELQHLAEIDSSVTEQMGPKNVMRESKQTKGVNNFSELVCPVHWNSHYSLHCRDTTKKLHDFEWSSRSAISSTQVELFLRDSQRHKLASTPWRFNFCAWKACDLYLHWSLTTRSRRDWFEHFTHSI